jgi:hypothetical protein
VGAAGVRYKNGVEELSLDTMASPKNYTRGTKSENQTIWVNIESYGVAVEIYKRMDGRWYVTYEGRKTIGENGGEGIIGKQDGYTNREMARKVAVDWMRDHPRP